MSLSISNIKKSIITLKASPKLKMGDLASITSNYTAVTSATNDNLFGIVVGIPSEGYASIQIGGHATVPFVSPVKFGKQTVTCYSNNTLIMSSGSKFMVSIVSFNPTTNLAEIIF
ncbi:MAG: hypothetical protein KFW09_01825 [Oscillospiraceae bacterium]|nr:hypothetical protein [Oscillospiraceae bacterium]